LQEGRRAAVWKEAGKERGRQRRRRGKSRALGFGLWEFGFFFLLDGPARFAVPVFHSYFNIYFFYVLLIYFYFSLVL
jgi:hypothetical protein